MLRLLGMLIGVLSATVLFAELVGVVYLWSNGYLTASKIAEVRQIYKTDAQAEKDDQNSESQAVGVSRQEVQAARVMRVLDLESQGKELELLKSMTLNTENRLISERKTFDEIKAAFQTELIELGQRHQQESVEQARAVLLASPIEEAVERLMALPLEESIDLVRGMPEKSIAKILQGFSEAAATPERTTEQRKRGQQIFEALSRGQPVRGAINEAFSKISEGAAEPSPDGG
jgi:hypothetical protein